MLQGFKKQHKKHFLEEILNFSKTSLGFAVSWSGLCGRCWEHSWVSWCLWLFRCFCSLPLLIFAFLFWLVFVCIFCFGFSDIDTLLMDALFAFSNSSYIFIGSDGLSYIYNCSLGFFMWRKSFQALDWFLWHLIFEFLLM